MKYKKGNINEIILEKLQNGPIYIPTLVESISREIVCSAKSVYNVCNKLKKDETIIVHNKYASLSLIWIAKCKSKIEQAEKVYTNIYILSQTFNIKKPFIKNGSRTNNKIVSFNFKTISELDLFWTQAYTLLLMDNSNYNAQYLITPHDFFLYSRPDTDTFWLNSNVKNKAVTRLITSHALPIDAEVVRYRKREHGRQIEYILYENPLKNKSNVYMNVVGDYIFKSNFDKKVNEILENKLATLKKLPLQKVDENDIQNILNMKGDFTFTIVESHVKAEKMKQKLKKYFK